VYPNREVFPNAPLALVAAEVRFTDAARLRQQQTRDEVAIALEGLFPYAEPFQRADFNLAGGVPSQAPQHDGMVLSNGSSTETLTIMADSLIYQTTAYRGFEGLLESMTAACDTLVAAGIQPAMRRVGLRYVDEVRVPVTISDVRQWSRWIDDRLIGHLAVGPDDVPVTVTQTIATFDLGDDLGFTFRCAAMDEGTIVVSEHLSRPPVEDGPFFVLDLDGFMDFTSQAAVPLSAKTICDSLSAAHVPCGTAFQRSITDEARALFRGASS